MNKHQRYELSLSSLFNLFISCYDMLFFLVSVRYEILQETVLAYRREILSLQERNQKMAATAQRHEHIIHTMSQDLRQTNEKLALEEVRSIVVEKNKLKIKATESTHCGSGLQTV